MYLYIALSISLICWRFDFGDIYPIKQRFLRRATKVETKLANENIKCETDYKAPKIKEAWVCGIQLLNVARIFGDRPPPGKESGLDKLIYGSQWTIPDTTANVCWCHNSKCSLQPGWAPSPRFPWAFPPCNPCNRIYHFAPPLSPALRFYFIFFVFLRCGCLCENFC